MVEEQRWNGREWVAVVPADAQVPFQRGCEQAGCARRHYGRGLCHWHYQQTFRAAGRSCALDGCSEPWYATGLCRAHHEQQRRRARHGQVGERAVILHPYKHRVAHLRRAVSDTSLCGRTVRTPSPAMADWALCQTCAALAHSLG